MHLIAKLDRQIANIEYGLLVLLIGSLTLILTAQVILRYFFSSPLFWAEEIAVQLLISASFIGVSYLTYADKLVRVDFILDLLPKAFRNLLEMLLRVIALATLLLVCYHATEWILRPEIKADISPTTGLPRWYNYAVLVAAFYVMTWHLTIRLITSKHHAPDATHTAMSEEGDS